MNCIQSPNSTDSTGGQVGLSISSGGTRLANAALYPVSNVHCQQRAVTQASSRRVDQRGEFFAFHLQSLLTERLVKYAAELVGWNRERENAGTCPVFRVHCQQRAAEQASSRRVGLRGQGTFWNLPSLVSGIVCKLKTPRTIYSSPDSTVVCTIYRLFPL